MRLATKSLGVPSARPFALAAVAPLPSDKPVASSLHREVPERPSALAAAVAPLSSDEPVAYSLHREAPTWPSAFVAVAPLPSDEPTAPSSNKRDPFQAMVPLGHYRDPSICGDIKGKTTTRPGWLGMIL